MTQGIAGMALQTPDNRLTLGECLSGLLPCDTHFAGNAVSGIAMDSRQLQAGYIFVATQGISQHGIVFLAAALDKKPSAVIVQTRNAAPGLSALPETLVSKARLSQVPLIFADIDSGTLASLANRVYGFASKQCRVIGITGTNGKTSCAHYLAQVIDWNSGGGAKAAIIGTLGNGFYGQLADTSHTTPDMFTVHRLISEFHQAGASHVVMEVSSHGLDQGRVDGVTFEAALFTNLTQDHLDYHESMHEYGLAKQKLFLRKGLSVAIVNGDDAYASALKGAVSEKVDWIVYGCEPQNHHRNYVQAVAVELKHDGLVIQVESYKGNFELQCHLMGRFNVSNVLAVCAYLLHTNISREWIQAAIAELKAVPGRMQLVSYPLTSVVAVVDYAHTPDALEKAITAVREHLHANASTSGRLCVVFGCGGDRDPGKRPLMGRVAAAGADRIIITDDNPRTESAQAIVDAILRGTSGHPDCSVVHDRQQAIAQAIQGANSNDVILIAGKGHENYQIIGREKREMPCDADLAQAALAARHAGVNGGAA